MRFKCFSGILIPGMFLMLGMIVFYTGRSFAIETEKLVSNEYLYPTEISPSESLIDFGSKKNKGIIDLPFASQPNANRGSADFVISMDASFAIKYYLDLENMDPDITYSNPVLYLKSEKGWYSASGTPIALSDPNKTRFVFLMNKMRTEGTPTGFHKIDAIRVAIYRKEDKDSRLRLIGFTSPKPSILIVQTKSSDSSSYSLVKGMQNILRRSLVSFQVLEEENLTQERITGSPIIMVPYQEKMSKKSVAMLIDYAKRGGMLIAAYLMPSELMNAMGFQSGKYVRADRSGYSFREMKINPKSVGSFHGLIPESLFQSSHNIISTQPIPDKEIQDPFLKEPKNKPRIIAWWYDAEGKKTDHPAILQSGYGLYFSHVLYQGGDEEKGKFLRAFCLLRDPVFRRDLLLERWREIFTIGRRLENDSREFDKQVLPEILQFLKSRGWTTDQIEGLLKGNISPSGFEDYTRFTRDLDQLKENRILAFTRTIEGKNGEARFWWEHSGTGAYPGDWDRTCRELADLNYTGIAVNMLWGGSAHYKSDFLPPHKHYLKYGDQVDQAAKACRKYGLELHVWKVNFNMLNAPDEFTAQMEREGRTQIMMNGERKKWLCPSHPKNRQLEIDVMLEVAKKYPVDGIHFDYIRYDGGGGCFCPGCQERFGKYYFEKTGRKIVDLVKEYKSDKDIQKALSEWKADQITAVVRGVRERVKKECPRVKMSAAVFRDYPNCRDIFGQDWVKWIKAGYLDFVCPMDYTNNLSVFDGWIKKQRELIGKDFPLYPGIGLSSSSSSLRADQTAIQIEMTRKLGAQGYVIFCLNEKTINGVGKILKKGPNRNKTK